VTRSEVGRPFSIPLNPVRLVVTPYLFGAAGERVIYQPTAAQLGDVYISNWGIGTRFNLPAWADYAFDSYAFVEASRGYVVPAVLGTPNYSSRVFAGLLLQY
jgi:hypothetical protein